MKSVKEKVFYTKEEKVKILTDGIKHKLAFKRPNQYEKNMIFLGSSGVGKSTIIMKLAKRYTQNNKVAIVSLGKFDKYANCRLSSFCKDENIEYINIDNITNENINQEKLKDYDVVLIDTVGRVASDIELRFDITQYNLLDEVSFSLVLPSTIKYKDYIDTYDAYSSLCIEGIVISKLDETKHFSSVIKFLNKNETPHVSYISVGAGERFNDYLVEYKI
ncbi:hypothetical protein [Candidatus Sulfurimonas baltica]|uniref:Flagellar biosynthesis protein FlhF n=1 Tax=Candidatus Sulfurimonas baltica TaxID=2740404 RepID=A0A7S7LX69_9BACT|nr:hypothetical protein [Candidatus Sulfurimonas baltica]QOY53030.1 hypothetical protein HUE88_04935 [Candidatus Sulfurimonas baltica]